MARTLGRARYRPIDPRDDNLALDRRAAHQQHRAREQREVRVIIEEEERPPAFFDAYDLAVIGMYEDDEAEGGGT